MAYKGYNYRGTWIGGEANDLFLTLKTKFPKHELVENLKKDFPKIGEPLPVNAPAGKRAGAAGARKA
jgi:hypothetical protein